MMLEFVLVFMMLMLIIAAMAVGVMMGRKPLKGSCGGVGAALGEKTTTVTSVVMIPINAMR